MAALVVDFLKRNFLRSSVRVGSISQTLTFWDYKLITRHSTVDSRTFEHKLFKISFTIFQGTRFEITRFEIKFLIESLVAERMC